jgi:hypothetical protein
MTERNKLYNTLLTCSERKISARVSVHVYTKTSSHAFSILLEDGKIVNLLPPVDLSEILKKDNSIIRRVLFKNPASANKSPTTLTNSVQSVPDILDIIQILSPTESEEKERRTTLHNDETEHLLESVTLILEDIIGSSATNEIKSISAIHPPATQTHAFLNRCKEIVAIATGGKAANTLFAPIFATLLEKYTERPPERPFNMVVETAEILTPFVGPNTIDQIKKIAAKHPPKHQPTKFLDGCKSLVEISVNKKIADKLFSGLYERVNRQKHGEK